MTTLLILLCVVLVAVVAVQIGRVTELAASVRGEKESENESNDWNGKFFLVFGALFLAFVVISPKYYMDSMLWYGVNKSASEHGGSIDSLFNTTLVFTGIVFFLTHFALFWFSYKYRADENRKAYFQPHDNRLEIIWTAIPAVVMTFLVVAGLDAWNTVMADVGPNEDYMEIEATGSQFLWDIRYPGADGKIGTKNWKMISGTNKLGQDWSDAKNLDDFSPDEIVLPVGKKVRVRITAKDVLHNFYLPHFRVKMDAIPGLPTYFVFKPIMTTEQYRQQLKSSPEWNEPYDEAEPTGKKRWEAFNYELACAELCGKGHYSMRKVVKIVTQEEYDVWVKAQKSIYEQNIKGTPEDPFKATSGVAADSLAAIQFAGIVEKAIADAKSDIIQLDHVNFETGSNKLTVTSKFQLDALVSVLEKHPAMTIEVEGHTDNKGDANANLTLSQKRSDAVRAYLTAKKVAPVRMKSLGFGSTKPLDAADTDEARAKNRRTEFKILTR
jgi:cytochrome c oxidase subunit 2